MKIYFSQMQNAKYNKRKKMEWKSIDLHLASRCMNHRAKWYKWDFARMSNLQSNLCFMKLMQLFELRSHNCPQMLNLQRKFVQIVKKKLWKLTGLAPPTSMTNDFHWINANMKNCHCQRKFARYDSIHARMLRLVNNCRVK